MHLLLSAAIIFLTLLANSPALEAGSLQLSPETSQPQPLQRSLDEIHELPTASADCPVCKTPVNYPLVNRLMRKSAAYSGPLDNWQAWLKWRQNPLTRIPSTPKWRLQASQRDADTCPYPAPNLLDYQADLVTCPACGYTRENEHFAEAVTDNAAQWTRANLQPSLRQSQIRLLGKRAAEMPENEIVAFFNSQDLIPDTVRTEHHRTFLAATHAPALARAKANLLAAWAIRRYLATPPKGPVFAKNVQPILTELAKYRKTEPDTQADIAQLRIYLRRTRQGREGLPGAADMAGRILQAGLADRVGNWQEAEKILQTLLEECRERFLHPDQDPLWNQTSTRATRSHRLGELESIRQDCEREVNVRLDMLRREREILLAAAGCLKDALRHGELDGQPDAALFHAYQTAEALRRAGNLPLAAEWFKNILNLAPPDSDLAQAATLQLEAAASDAGDKINLLSAFGQDGDLFAILRRIRQEGYPAPPPSPAANDHPKSDPLEE